MNFNATMTICATLPGAVLRDNTFETPGRMGCRSVVCGVSVYKLRKKKNTRRHAPLPDQTTLTRPDEIRASHVALQGKEGRPVDARHLYI